jgi:hypothetical protein
MDNLLALEKVLKDRCKNCRLLKEFAKKCPIIKNTITSDKMLFSLMDSCPYKVENYIEQNLETLSISREKRDRLLYGPWEERGNNGIK